MKSPAYETTCHKNVARNIYYWTGVHKLQHVSQLKYGYNFQVCHNVKFHLLRPFHSLLVYIN